MAAYPNCSPALSPRPEQHTVGRGLPERYALLRQVGQGSFGAALLVREQRGQLFIAKEMRLAQMDAKELEGVNSEVQLLRALKHPNIVRYEECVQAGSVLYIVMEYADGGDLYERVRALENPMPEDEVLNLFAQICLAIKHLHDRRILHRDLKTQNVFLTQGGIVKLGDFGLATCLRHSWQQAQTLCGTPNYFSPELVRGRPYGNKSDIWALGCVLYELLARDFAFSGKSLPEIMARICNEAPAPIPAQYSQPLQHILGKVLAKEQGIRPNVDNVLRAHVLQAALERIRALLQGAAAKHPREGEEGGAGTAKPQQALSPPGAALSPTLSSMRAPCVTSSLDAPGVVPTNTPQTCTNYPPAPSPVPIPPSATGAVLAKDEDLAALENDILSDLMQRRTGAAAAADAAPPLSTALRDAAAPRAAGNIDNLLEEVQRTLTGLEGDTAAAGADFGDEDAYAAPTPTRPSAAASAAAASPSPQAAGGGRSDRLSQSFDGEIDTLLNEFQQLDDVIGKK